MIEDDSIETAGENSMEELSSRTKAIIKVEANFVFINLFLVMIISNEKFEDKIYSLNKVHKKCEF
jgi:hypothetical protein